MIKAATATTVRTPYGAAVVASDIVGSPSSSFVRSASSSIAGRSSIGVGSE